jgi:hypothetical protein
MWNAADYIAKSLKLDPNQFASYCIEKYIMDAVEKAEAAKASTVGKKTQSDGDSNDASS